MDLNLVLEQRLAVTPQLVMANTLLHLSSTELEQAIAQELAENPLLELVEVRRCPGCGRAMPDGSCPFCGRPDFHAEARAPADWETGADEPSFSEDDDVDELDDEVSRLGSDTTLPEHLLYQLRPSLPLRDLPVATYLVESLDEHGFLCCDLDDVASLFGAERACVERIVAAVQELDPVGIAARDIHECLLIQIEHLRREGLEQPLARALITDHWEALGRQSFAEIARAAGTSVGEIQAALQFIKDNLNPFPAHAHWADLHEPPPRKAATYPRPDVIITNGRNSPAKGYEIELPGARGYRFRISASYLEADRASSERQDWEQWEAFYARARLFIHGIEQRWRTLDRMVRYLTDYQRDFLASGDKCLRPLTRARLANMMGVHESTISRAVANKYVQLPCGRMVPLAKFFDSSAPVKESIKELIAHESGRLSDREIAERLAREGFCIARRTVTKYRNALNILPSPLR